MGLALLLLVYAAWYYYIGVKSLPVKGGNYYYLTLYSGFLVGDAAEFPLFDVYGPLLNSNKLLKYWSLLVY